MKLTLKKNSLTLRLCFCMFVGILIIIVCSSFTVYGLIQQNFDKNISHFLEKELLILNNILRRPNAQEALNQEVIWEPSVNHSYLIKITTLSGKIIKLTPGIEAFSQELWPLPSTVKQLNFKKIKIKNKTFALTRNIIYVPHSAFSHYEVSIAYDISKNKNILDSFINLLFLITAIGMIFSIIISFILINIGLRPLSYFVSHIEKLDLDSRAPVPLPQIISEFKPLVGALDQLFLRIKASYDRMANFSSNMAHEIRNPINNLMLQTELSLTKSLPAQKIQEMLESNLDEYSRLNSLVDKLLFLARSESIAFLSRQKLNFYNEAKAVIEFYQALCEEKNIIIEIINDGEILADKTLFRNALSNLLTNAINYGGSYIKILISVESSSSLTKISVIDNGKGIAAEDLPFLTDRFYRAHRESITTEAGLGLGLAIVQSIMKTHQGFLKIESELGKGTTVLLAFPIIDSAY